MWGLGGMVRERGTVGLIIVGREGLRQRGWRTFGGKGGYVGEDYPTMMVGGVSMVELRCRRLGDHSNCK